MEYNKVKTMLGKKFYSYTKEDDTIDIVRVTEIKNEKQITIQFENGETKKINPDDVYKEYTELIPDGFITFSIVKMKLANKEIFADDVIVCIHTTNDLDRKDNEPAVVCRQNITDFFYNYITANENHDHVGVSVSKKSCPANIDYSIMRACDDISYFIGVNFYITDSLPDILDLLGSKTKKFNVVLDNGISQYIKKSMKLDIGQKQINGWCRDLKTLLINNDFEYDYNSTFNIVPIGIELKDHLIEVTDEDDTYESLDAFMTKNLSDLYKINITKTIVVKYYHDIDLDEVYGKYFLCRDSENNLYIVKYTTEGEYFDLDLAQEAMKNLKLQSGILANRILAK